MLTIDINGEKRQLPSSWDEVTFKQFIELEKCKTDFVKVFALFTGIDEDTVRRAKIINLDSILLAMSFVHTQVDMKLPKIILGYNVPKDLGFETVGQYQDIKSDLAKQGELTGTEQLEKYALYCAVYACSQKYGEYDWQKAEEMQGEFFNAPCPEVLAIGNFTLMKLIGLTSSTKADYRKRSTILRRLRLALTAYRMRLAFMLRSFTWRKKRSISAQNF